MNLEAIKITQPLSQQDGGEECLWVMDILKVCQQGLLMNQM